MLEGVVGLSVMLEGVVRLCMVTEEVEGLFMVLECVLGLSMMLEGAICPCACLTVSTREYPHPTSPYHRRPTLRTMPQTLGLCTADTEECSDVTGEVYCDKSFSGPVFMPANYPLTTLTTHYLSDGSSSEKITYRTKQEVNI